MHPLPEMIHAPQRIFSGAGTFEGKRSHCRIHATAATQRFSWRTGEVRKSPLPLLLETAGRPSRV